MEKIQHKENWNHNYNNKQIFIYNVNLGCIDIFYLFIIIIPKCLLQFFNEYLQLNIVVTCCDFRKPKAVYLSFLKQNTLIFINIFIYSLLYANLNKFSYCASLPHCLYQCGHPVKINSRRAPAHCVMKLSVICLKRFSVWGTFIFLPGFVNVFVNTQAHNFVKKEDSLYISGS